MRIVKQNLLIIITLTGGLSDQFAFPMILMGSNYLLQLAEADIQKALWELPLLTGIHLLM
ncbi:hypothetical protein DWW86_09685 [Ruminococcus sp. AF17-22AC]|nr:hypothetical protein DWW86_09685 [Ruminococcus sp. AF17-22AC]